MILLSKRLRIWEYLSEAISNASGLNDKRRLLQMIPDEMEDDVQFIFEILAGGYKLGYTYIELKTDEPWPVYYERMTIRQYLEPLWRPLQQGDLSNDNILRACKKAQWFSHIVAPIVNRTLRLGIGRSVLPKDGLGAMLGKTYDGWVPQSRMGYFITEKLDGNRCIARFNGTRWVFTSRNGKPMKVNFSMDGLPTEYIYDGEILSVEQTEQSCKLYDGSAFTSTGSTSLFQSTSGVINSKYGKKDLVYNIFDILDDNLNYAQRRLKLNELIVLNTGGDIRILPVLQHYLFADELNDNIGSLLTKVTSAGAEGLMINIGDGSYEHKRSSNLLKYKKAKTIDMKVVEVYEGNGKYIGAVGSLFCVAKMPDGKMIQCHVGSGLSDEQRNDWYDDINLIVGKIVEVEYFSTSQSKSYDGSDIYSLRFPRLKSVREDKAETSIY